MISKYLDNFLHHFYRLCRPPFVCDDVNVSWSVGRFIFSKVVRILLYSSLSVALKGK